MSVLKSIVKPSELAALFKLKFSKQHNHANVLEILEHDTNMKFCFKTLDKVSRSFAAVIKQLPQELSISICLFYLILRALDSIEDDMELPNDKKIKLLLNFHKKNYENGWKLENVGDKAVYRDLLANYDLVIAAFSTLSPKYQKIITDACEKMGSGMADFVAREIVSLADYNLYCHHVAGIVGIGLSQIFAASEMENPEIQFQEELANSMGLFLQKTNIVRDYKEDIEENRSFWPKAIWSLYTSKLESFATFPGTATAMACLNHLINDALAHAIDCLDYLKQLKNEHVFKFCAIPQVMAIATLCEVYNNPQVFTKNVKIRKGYAAKLMLNTNSVLDVVKIYHHMAHAMEAMITQNTPKSIETLVLVQEIKKYCATEIALANTEPAF